MTKTATVTMIAALSAALLLAGCGHHDHESDDATPNNVEMPAADLPAGPPSMTAPPPAHDPDADASTAAQTAQDAATNDAANAASVAEQARAAAAEAEQQQNSNGETSHQPTPPPQ